MLRIINSAINHNIRCFMSSIGPSSRNSWDNLAGTKSSENGKEMAQPMLQLSYASQSLKNDREIILAAVAQNRLAGVAEPRLTSADPK
jgi:hypothetical protein